MDWELDHSYLFQAKAGTGGRFGADKRQLSFEFDHSVDTLTKPVPAIKLNVTGAIP